jgi:hypothetical protein
VYLHHEAAMANLEAMAEKLLPHGYDLFVIDGGWYGEFDLFPGTLYPKEKHAKRLRLNEYGIFQPSETYFPQGFGPIVERARQLGIRMGIHLMRGVPRQAVDQRLPIKNSPYKTSDICDKHRNCHWNPQTFGVDPGKPGAQDWYDSVVKQVADWGFDFIKYDDLTPYPDEILLVSNAVDKVERPITLSLSPGGAYQMNYLPYYRRADMLRVTGDIWDRPGDIAKGFDAARKFQGISHPGFWIDLDMIPFGNLQMMVPEELGVSDDSAEFSGHGFRRKSNFSKAEMRTFITIRALGASPLFMGGDLPTLDDFSLNLLTHPEMLACNQNGVSGWNTHRRDGVEVWNTPHYADPYQGWIGVFNRNPEKVDLSLSREQLGFQHIVEGYEMKSFPGTVELVDVWNGRHRMMEEISLDLELPAGDVWFCRFKAKRG